MNRTIAYNAVRMLPALAVMLIAASAMAAPADDQFRVAAGHYSASRWSESASEFRYFLEQFPEHARARQARFFLAEALVQLGKYSQARPHFVELVESGEQFRYAKQALFRAGETAYLSGKSIEARLRLEKFYELHTEDAWCTYALPYLGELALVAGDAQQAQRYYSDSLRRFPQGPLVDQCRFGMARSLELQNQHHDAQRFYRLLADGDGAFADNAVLRSGTLDYQRRRHAEAAETLSAFVGDKLAESPLRIHGLYWLGAARMGDGDWQAAAAALKLAAETDPISPLLPAIQFAWGKALQHGGQHQPALDRYRQVYETWADSDFADDALHAALQLAAENDDEQLIADFATQFTKQFDASPLTVHVHQSVGRWRLERRQYDLAIEIFERLTASAQSDNQTQDSPLGQPQAPPTDPVPRIAPTGLDPELFAAANWYYLSLAYLGVKRHEDALAALDKSDFEKHAALRDGAYLARAAALVELRRFRDALPFAEAYLKSQPDGPDSASCRAHHLVSLINLERFEQCAASYEKFAQRHAEHELFLPTTYYLAERAFEKKQFELAEGLFERLTQDGVPDEYVQKGRNGLAWIDFETGDAASTADAFERMLKENPDAPAAAEAALIRAKALEKLDKLPAALEMYQSIIENHPDSPQMPHALLGAAKLLDELELDSGAATLLERFTKNFPHSPQIDTALYLWAWVLDDLEQPDLADEKFELVVEEYPNSPYWSDSVYRLAQRAARRKEYGRAEQLVDRLIAAAPEGELQPHALYLKGQLAAAEKRWSEVEPPLTTLLAEFPESSLRLPARYWIAESAYRQAKFDLAGERFTRLLAETVRRRESWTAMIPLRLAQIMAHANKWDEAHQLAQGIAKQYPDFSQQYEVDYLIGRCLQSKARFDFNAAREAYARVTHSATGGATETAAMAQWMIGETYFHQKNYEQAVRAYYRVEQLFDYPRWQALALLQIGKCFEVQTKYAKAVETYQQVVKQYNQTEPAREAERRLTVARQRLSMSEPATRN